MQYLESIGINNLSNDYQLVVHCYTPSPGGKHRQGESLLGPVQWRRECGTLYETTRRISIESKLLNHIYNNLLGCKGE
jgi:hypothetical protein